MKTEQRPGLAVELAAEQIAEAGSEARTLNIAASDPESFRWTS